MLAVSELMVWYNKEKRDFPWRVSRDPYLVWICEVMSQQTTMAVVVPYFERFVAALPNLQALASCDETLLRNLWSGLGYYSRMRNLQKGARQILEWHGGNFPKTYAEWCEISGCGPYTAAVVASVCFNEPVPCIDGNVVRVAARQALYGEEVHQRGFHAVLKAELEKIIVTENPGDFNQALMELGATVCTPRKPRCGICPVSQSCHAFASGKTSEYPKPKPRAEFKQVSLVAFVVRAKGSTRVLLSERTRGFLKSTVGFPLLEARSANGEELFAELKQAQIKYDLAPRSLRHTITRHKLLVNVVELVCRNAADHAFFASFFGSRKNHSARSASEFGSVAVPVSQVAASLSTSLDSKVWAIVGPRSLSKFQ